jgi:hypothetical protein
MSDFAWLLLPKTVKVLMALAMGVGGTMLLSLWLVATLMKAGVF